MTFHLPTTLGPTWMEANRLRIGVAIAATLSACAVVAGVEVWPGGGSSEPRVNSRPVASYPASRENVRGPIFPAGDELGVTVDAVQPSVAERHYPASRENVRGPIFPE